MKIYTAIGSALLMAFVWEAHAEEKEPVVATYYSSVGDPKAVALIEAEKLSHVIYAFLVMCGDHAGQTDARKAVIKTACKDRSDFEAVILDEAQSLKELDAFRDLKNRNPRLRILPSFGGWTLSKPFHDMALTDTSRQKFVARVLALITRHDVFDGIDIDWEYPGGGGASQALLGGAGAKREKRAFRLLMKEFREGLDALTQQTGRTYELSAAVSGMAGKAEAIDWIGTHPYMDLVFVMTYDFLTGDGEAWHHTNLQNTCGANQPSGGSGQFGAVTMINNMLAAGVPAEKLVLGAAFYGRGWSGVPWQGDRPRHVETAKTTGTYIYSELRKGVHDQRYREFYDACAGAAYLREETTGLFISFDNPKSILAKTDYIRQQGLAGIFSWQVVQDNGELIGAMHQGMTKTKEK